MPTIRKITFLSRKHAEAILTPVNMISIGDALDKTPEFRAEHNLLRLTFDSTTASPTNWFTFEQAQDILGFLRETKGDVTVHCEAGKSRSAAVAKFASDKLGFYLDRIHPCVGKTDEVDRRVYEMLIITLRKACNGDSNG